MARQIRLTDGSSWEIVAGHQQTIPIVACLSKAMQFRLVQQPVCRLIVLNECNPHFTPGTDTRQIARCSYKNENTVTCSLFPADNETTFVLQLRQLSLVLSQYSQTRGGVLLHGALAEWADQGIILAGRSGVGKTTASQRLVSPWKSLSDDLTLVVSDTQGKYWAHPWPTWSRFLPNGSGGTWDVQHAVPLKGIFFLTQAHNDLVESIGPGRAVGLLVNSCAQAGWGMPESVHAEQQKLLCLQCFDNICRLGQTVACYILHLSLSGAFWYDIENTIG